jgi:two-component system OmpR family response regulator
MRILIVEDDQVIAENIKEVLSTINFVSEICLTGEEGQFKAETEDYDGIILDRMLPDTDGLKVCKNLRKNNIITPILFLTAKAQLDDKVEGLSLGADDYLTKPFAMLELIERVKALVRRKYPNKKSSLIKVANLFLDTNTHVVKRNGKIIELSPKEFSMLEYLMMNECVALTRMQIIEHVWGEEVDPFSNTVDVHINYLRKKIDENDKTKLIHTIKGKGYMLCEK